jgi:hypothetical protein
MRLKVASSSASSETVTRCRPASFSDWALRASRAVHRAQFGQHAHQPFQVLAQQRFAAGQADLFDPMLDEQPCNAGDLFERQQRIVRQVLVVLVEHFLRHTVDAAEVAAVGDGNAQVVQRTGELVPQAAAWRLERGGDDWRLAAAIIQEDDFFGHAGVRLHPVR